MTEEQWQENKYDIVFINRTWDNEDLIERRKEHGFKLVVDVDDYWHLSHDHLMYEGYNASNFAARLINHMRAAESMLSVANCQLELKDIKAAKKTLGDVVKNYPHTEAAAAANERLAKLK